MKTLELRLSDSVWPNYSDMKTLKRFQSGIIRNLCNCRVGSIYLKLEKALHKNFKICGLEDIAERNSIYANCMKHIVH